jgi:hypothetical protein
MKPVLALAIGLALAPVVAAGQEVRFATREEIAAETLREARLLLVFRVSLGLWFLGCAAAGIAIWRKRSTVLLEDSERVRSALQKEVRKDAAELLNIVPARLDSAASQTPGWVALLKDRVIAIDSSTGRTRSLHLHELADSMVVEAGDSAVSVLLRGTAGELKIAIDHVADGARLVDALRRMGLTLQYRRRA